VLFCRLLVPRGVSHYVSHISLSVGFDSQAVSQTWTIQLLFGCGEAAGSPRSILPSSPCCQWPHVSVMWFGTNLTSIACLLTYLLTPWSRVLPEKLTSFQLVKKFPTFYGTQRFITSFTSARHLSLSWASLIQSIPSHPTSWNSILILPSHLCLGLPNGLLPSGFPTRTLYTPLFSHIHATCPAHLILLDFYHPNSIGWAVQVIKVLIMSFFSTPLLHCLS